MKRGNTLAVTAYARPEDRDRSILAGFQMHLAKPIEPSELIVSVATRAKKSATSQLRILLVEDHEASRRVLAKLLEGRHHKVTSTGSVGQALEAAKNGPHDLVITDLGLPDGSGSELMTELHRKFGLKGIALSGYDQPHDASLCEKAGFVAHLTKPVSIESLETALALVTSLSRKCAVERCHRLGSDWD